jgi:ribonuclease Z
MKWPVWAIGLFLMLAIVTVASFKLMQPQIAERAFQRAISENIGRDRSADLEDGLHVYVCGAGSPMPDPFRGGPCLGVIAGGRIMMFDAGSGGSRNLVRMGFPTGRVETVYLTHLHSDHIDGLGEAMLQAWVGGARKSPLHVSGPEGTRAVVEGFNAAYRIDSSYRTAHHGPHIADPSGYGAYAEEIFLPAGPDGIRVLLDDGDLTITAFAVSHSPVKPAFGYRIDYRGRSIAISGDSVYHPGLVVAAKEVDVLFHDALQPEMVVAMSEAARARGADNLSDILVDILDYHASPVDAARAARDAGVRELVLYHIVPPLPSKQLHRMFVGEAGREFSGRITLAKDGMIISLPTETDDIVHRRGF